MNEITYKMKLIIESPTYIGDSQEVTKLDFFEKNNLVYYIDHQKLFKVLEENNLFDQYLSIVNKEEELILNHQKNKNSPDLINDFYFRNFEQIIDAILYKLPIEKNKNRVGTIDTFIKTYDYKPYIPGSSIKGAIRTSIMEEYGIDKNVHIKGISVSDTEPVAIDNLIILPRNDLIFKKNKTPFLNSLSIYSEYLRQGTELDFTIKLDFNQLNESVPNIKSIQDVLNLINKRYDRIINILNLTNEANKYTINKNNLMFLGGYSGFHSKTIIAKDPLRVREETKIILSNQKPFKNHKHENDDIISPRTYKIISTSKGNLFVGLVRLEVIK